MIQALSHQKWILVVIALLIAGGVWYGMSSSAPSPELVSTPLVATDNSAEQGLIATLLTLRAVKLDGTIFMDPVFTSLKDFSTEIVEEPVGRENPFAPLPAQSVSPSSTKGAQIFSP